MLGVGVEIVVVGVELGEFDVVLCIGFVVCLVCW